MSTPTDVFDTRSLAASAEPMMSGGLSGPSRGQSEGTEYTEIDGKSIPISYRGQRINPHIAAFFDDARKLYEESLLPALSKEIQDDRAITRPTPKRNAWQSSHKTSPQIKPHFESLKSAQTRYKALYFGEGSPAQFAGPKEDAETEAMVWWFKTKDALAANHQSAAPTITDSIPDSGTISSFTPSQT